MLEIFLRGPVDFEIGGVFVMVTLPRFVMRRGGVGVDGRTHEIAEEVLVSSVGSGASVSSVALIVDFVLGVALTVSDLVR